jgi:hypothetical protein
MPNYKDIDAAIDALFAGAVLVPRDRAFKALGIQKSYGHELINDGVLERVKLGNASRITVESIKRAAHGLPRCVRRKKITNADKHVEPVATAATPALPLDTNDVPQMGHSSPSGCHARRTGAACHPVP